MKRSMFCMLLILIMLLSGCGNNTVTPTAESLPTESPISASMENDGFSLSVVEDPNDESRRFEANGFCIDYIGLSEVSYTTASKSIPLQNALQDGIVTVNMLIANARDDAEEKICRETTTTTNGLTQFSYTYPEYRMNVIYDIYQTPDGKEHLVKEINISATSHHVGSITIIDDATGMAIDREDWGITLELVEATPSSITIHCTQEGGQHFGELQAYACIIVSEDGEYFLTSEETAGIPLEKFMLVQNGETTFTVSWAESHGELPAGKYYFRITFEDIYDAASLHPLTRNFNDWQSFFVPFEIE